MRCRAADMVGQCRPEQADDDIGSHQHKAFPARRKIKLAALEQALRGGKCLHHRLSQGAGPMRQLHAGPYANQKTPEQSWIETKLAEDDVSMAEEATS
jgi:hypothetical protein